MKKYLYDTFEEYLEYAPFDETHPHLEAFKIIWNMARIPGSVLDNVQEDNDIN